MLHTSASNLNKVLIILLFVLLMGCSDSRKQEITPSPIGITSTGIYRSQIPNAPIKTPTASVFSPTITSINTEVPIFTSTPQPIASPTWTLVPTLPSDKAIEKLLGLYTDNGGCQLPCWWGITPGKSTWQITRDTLFSMGNVYGPLEKNGVERYEPEYKVPENVEPLGYIWPTIWVEDDVVIAIGTNSRWITPDFDYSLAGFLITLGVPDQIWLKLETDTMADPHYEIRLFYEEGIEIGATGDAKILGDKLRLCPQEFKQGEFPPGILLWAPAKEVTFNNLESLLGNLTNRNGENFYLLEDLTEQVDHQAFYETYLDPASKICMDFDLSQLPK